MTVGAGETLSISGRLSHDSAGTFIGTGDFEPQMRTTLGNLDRVLERFGARPTRSSRPPSWHGACGTTSTPSPARTPRTAATTAPPAP